MMAPQQLCDVVGGAVAQLNPNKLRRRAMQDGKSVKVFVLAADQAPVLTRQVPDRRIRCAALPEQSNVQGARREPGKTSASFAHNSSNSGSSKKSRAILRGWRPEGTVLALSRVGETSPHIVAR